MRNAFIGLLLLLTFSFKTKEQVISEKELVGSWKVLKIQTTLEDHIPQDQKANKDRFENALLQSKFYFEADKNFSFDISLEDLQIKKAHWKFDSSTNSIIIQEWKDINNDKFILMEVVVKKEGEKILFILSEAFTTLEMKKE